LFSGVISEHFSENCMYTSCKNMVRYLKQESSAVAEKPARRDSIPNSSRRNPQKLEMNIQCIYYGYIQLEIQYLVSEFRIQITSTYSS